MYIGVVSVCLSVYHVDSVAAEDRRDIRSYGDFKRIKNGLLLKCGLWEEQVITLEMELGGFRLDKPSTGCILGVSCLFHGYMSTDVSGES